MKNIQIFNKELKQNKNNKWRRRSALYVFLSLPEEYRDTNYIKLEWESKFLKRETKSKGEEEKPWKHKIKSEVRVFSQKV